VTRAAVDGSGDAEPGWRGAPSEWPATDSAAANSDPPAREFYRRQQVVEAAGRSKGVATGGFPHPSN
jgi:hypothetical protein